MRTRIREQQDVRDLRPRAVVLAELAWREAYEALEAAEAAEQRAHPGCVDAERDTDAAAEREKAAWQAYQNERRRAISAVIE